MSNNQVISIKSQNLTLKVKINNNKLAPYGNLLHNTHFFNILDKHLTSNYNPNNIKEFAKETNIYNYCVCCHELLDCQASTFVTCGSLDCDYKFEELIVGNPVKNAITDNAEKVKFLLDSALHTILRGNGNRFEPFPTYFFENPQKTKELVNIKRGELSGIKGINIENMKNTEKLKTAAHILNNLSIDNLNKIKNDKKIISQIGKDAYILLRFIIMSNKTDIIINTELLENCDQVTVYSVKYEKYQLREFEELKKSNNNNTIILFHGSAYQNWYSIMRNGLKICSGTKLMTTGAAYGEGIYTSPLLNVPLSYGLTKCTGKNSKNLPYSTVGVFEVINDEGFIHINRANQYYVINNEKILLLKYILVFNNGVSQELTDLIQNTFITKKDERLAVRRNATIASKSIPRIIREIKIIKRSQKKSDLGFDIVIDGKSIHQWKILITHFDKNYPIYEDMQKYKIDNIELEITFPDNFPFSPPFIRIVRPRFERLTGHVTIGGSICMEILTQSGWSSASTIESLIITIKSQIIEGGGRLSPNFDKPYSLQEAKEAFDRAAKSHGWAN